MRTLDDVRRELMRDWRFRLWYYALWPWYAWWWLCYDWRAWRRRCRWQRFRRRIRRRLRRPERGMVRLEWLDAQGKHGYDDASRARPSKPGKSADERKPR